MKDKIFKARKMMVISIPYALLIVGLIILYIANVHRAERNLRNVKKLKSDVKEAKWAYQDLQQKILYSGTQNQLKKKLEGSGLKENRSVPKKIVIESKS